MGKPVGFYGLDRSNKLVSDMVETWGEALEGLDEADSLFIISTAAEMACECCPSGISKEAEEVRDRIDELNFDELVALIQAIAN